MVCVWCEYVITYGGMGPYMHIDPHMRVCLLCGLVSPDKRVLAKHLIYGNAIRRCARPDGVHMPSVTEQPAHPGQMDGSYLHTSPWTIAASMCDPH